MDIVFSHPEFHKREGTLMSSRNATREDFVHVIANIKNGEIRPANCIVYINGQKQHGLPSPNSFYALNRKWKNGDKVKLIFHYDFYVKEMPDDPNVFAIFYGPTMLSFKTSSELILKGTKAEILKSLKPSGGNYFTLHNGSEEYTLLPLFNVIDESFGVYATLRNY